MVQQARDNARCGLQRRRIALWDSMTGGISHQCSHHIHLITSLSWNRTGRKLDTKFRNQLERRIMGHRERRGGALFTFPVASREGPV